MKIKEFLETELVDYASYSIYRAIPSYIDGLKNAHRKVIYGIKKLNVNKEEKVSILKGKVESISNYLHGNIEGSIITLAKNYTGSNNLPLLKREGNFGTRFVPENSATRYIYTYKENYFDKLFRDDDNQTLIEQKFEGDIIEPRYYVPVLPLLIINGIEGIATGFSSKILSRNLNEVIEYLECKLKDKECNFELLPYFNGFKGKVKKVDNNKYEIEGVYEINKNNIIITEIPIGYEYKSYIKALDNLEEKKIIKSYKDESDPKTDTFRFIVKVDNKFLEKDVLKTLKLIKPITENLTTIDENNKIRIFNNIQEMFDAYIDIRLKHLTRKKELKIQNLQKEIEFLKDRINFIQAIIDNKIIINKKSKSNIIEQAKKINIVYIEDHLKMQLWNLTNEKIEELIDTYKQKEKELEKVKNTTEKEMWLNELNELKKLLTPNVKPTKSSNSSTNKSTLKSNIF